MLEARYGEICFDVTDIISMCDGQKVSNLDHESMFDCEERGYL